MNKKKFLYKEASQLLEKGSSLVREEIYQRRRNVMVMGDILEDVRMVKDSEHTTVLKVGFLNDVNAEKRVQEEYMDTFDIVIVGDGSLDPINSIIKESLSNNEQRSEKWRKLI